MKKLIISLALFSCLLPFNFSQADICETKCCGATGNCSDQTAFCKSLLSNNYASSTACIDEKIPANCAAGETKICCCSTPVTSGLYVDNSAKENNSQTKVTSLNFTPEISIPGSVFNNTNPTQIGKVTQSTNNGVETITMNSDLLAKYIQAVYNYGLAIVSILAAIILMGGGLIWLTSGGDSSKVTKAKEMIIGSISGLVILFCAWIILNTVNPELLKLKPISTVVISKVILTCCQQNNVAEIINEKDCQVKGGKSMLGYQPDSSNTKCELPGCCIVKTGGGKILNCSNSMKSNCQGTFVNIGCNFAMSSYSGDKGENCPDRCSLPDIKDGDHCYKSGGNAYCYFGACWQGSGYEGEPCGNEGGVCHNSKTWGLASCKHRDMVGGRDCLNGLACCLK